MSYKDLYNDALSENSKLHQTLTPTKIMSMLQNQYISKIDLLSTQQDLLSRQESLINDKNRILKKQTTTISDINDKIHTKKRIVVYDEKDDLFNQRIIEVLKISVFTLTLGISVLVYKNLSNK